MCGCYRNCVTALNALVGRKSLYNVYLCAIDSSNASNCQNGVRSNLVVTTRKRKSSSFVGVSHLKKSENLAHVDEQMMFPLNRGLWLTTWSHRTSTCANWSRPDDGRRIVSTHSAALRLRSLATQWYHQLKLSTEITRLPFWYSRTLHLIWACDYLHVLLQNGAFSFDVNRA